VKNIGCRYKWSRKECCELCATELNASKALWWGDWVPWLISTVIIDDMVHTNPPVPSGFNGVKSLICSTLPPVSGVGSTVSWSRHCAPFNIKVLVVSVEWCSAPIDFLQTTPCGPVICFPQCRIHSHRLHLRVRNPPSLVVLVHSDWNIIYVESARNITNSPFLFSISFINNISVLLSCVYTYTMWRWFHRME